MKSKWMFVIGLILVLSTALVPLPYVPVASAMGTCDAQEIEIERTGDDQITKFGPGGMLRIAQVWRPDFQEGKVHFVLLEPHDDWDFVGTGGKVWVFNWECREAAFKQFDERHPKVSIDELAEAGFFSKPSNPAPAPSDGPTIIPKECELDQIEVVRTSENDVRKFGPGGFIRIAQVWRPDFQEGKVHFVLLEPHHDSDFVGAGGRIWVFAWDNGCQELVRKQFERDEPKVSFEELAQAGFFTKPGTTPPAPQPPPSPSGGANVINDYDLVETMGEVATSGNFIHVEFWWDGQPERETILPASAARGGRFLLARPLKGHVWEYVGTEQEVRAQIDAHIARRRAGGANNAGFVEWQSTGLFRPAN